MKRWSVLSVTVAALSLLATQAQAGDAGKGEEVFKKKCFACHTVEAGKNKVGPSLLGVVGKPAGKAEGFKYSDDTLAISAKVTWTEALIVEYLDDPNKFLATHSGNAGAKSKMTFKLPDATERADVAAFLASKK
ncbi:MAG: c-type cytochrome [Magnetococcales bacterium]|nr:c-type cytochrome [Magnetococcales bacterium]